MQIRVLQRIQTFGHLGLNEMPGLHRDARLSEHFHGIDVTVVGDGAWRVEPPLGRHGGVCSAFEQIPGEPFHAQPAGVSERRFAAIPDRVYMGDAIDQE